MTSDSSPSPAQIFEDYFGPALFQTWAKVLIDMANPDEGEDVLDLACATGTVARMIAPSIGGSGSVKGLDFSPPMLAVARSAPSLGGSAVEWVEGDAAALPFDDSSFDLVICQQGLQFFPNREQSAREIFRVLKPGGRLVACVWQGTDVHPIFDSLFKLVATRLDAPFGTVSLPFGLGNPDELADYVRSGGFDKAEVTAHELDVEFRSPDRWVQLSMMGAAAAIPAFGELDADQRTALSQDIAESMASTLVPYIQGDVLKMATAVNTVVAVKP
jgi:SAM-dependent methyltransferase